MMKSRHLIDVIIIFGMVLLAAIFIGCTPSNQMDSYRTRADSTHPIIAILTPDIERLYLTWHELDQTYKGIKFLERGFLFDPDDRQLGYVQKVSLYVQDAAVRIRHRWEQLSVLHYIRPEMMRDYLTLNVKELTSAIREIGYDEKFLTIYGSFVTHEAATEDVNRALAKIRKNVDVLNQILEKILPLSNATAPPVLL